MALEYPQYATTRWSPPVIRCLICYNTYQNFWDYMLHKHTCHTAAIHRTLCLYCQTPFYTFQAAFEHFIINASHREVSPFCIVTSPSRHPPPSSANYCYIQTVGNIQCSKIPNYWYILCLICVQCCYCAC